MTATINHPRFRGNANYVEYVGLLLQLHDLIRRGLCDSEQADELRDRMDAPWYRLDKQEIARVDALSADLSTLKPDPPIQHPEEGGVQSEETRRTLKTLSDEGAWEKLLEFLRSNPSQVSASLAAFQRGHCWLELGEVEAAILFLRFATNKQCAA